MKELEPHNETDGIGPLQGSARTRRTAGLAEPPGASSMGPLSSGTAQHRQRLGGEKGLAQ